MSEAYTTLEERFARLYALREAAGLLHWDSAVLMPAGAAEARSEHLAALEVTCHEMLTDPRLAALFEAAGEQEDELDPWRQANLREMRREWLHATAVPARLVEALSRAARRCEMVWREARPASDFARVKPELAQVLSLVREEAAAKAAAFGGEPYDALLDPYEPDGRAARIDGLFEDLAAFLPGFLEEVLARQRAQTPPQRPDGPFSEARQAALAERVMRQLGFDFAHGRLDVSAHPFCGGTAEDLRVTTRYDEADFLTALMAVVHETGHALYERGLPAAWRRQPVGEARGMALHESQSLLMEMQAGRGPEFMRFLAPLLRETFDGEGPAWQADNLHRLVTRVEPGFIRVDADEVTYPAHVILRYRLEKAMIAGDLQLDDLPAAWNEGMRELLGLTPPDDRLGCLQDIHWYDGAWGYFPTYAMGALAAAQLFDAAVRTVPEIPEALARGDFAPLLDWLRANVHGHGSRLSTDEVLTQATGRPLDTAAFKAHLRGRYLGSTT